PSSVAHVSVSVTPALSRPPSFPSTTLFRSPDPNEQVEILFEIDSAIGCLDGDADFGILLGELGEQRAHQQLRHDRRATQADQARSEEHTSELQSPDHLVCRLLLEKKNRSAT